MSGGLGLFKDYVFSDRDIKQLYRVMGTLNNEVVAGREKLVLSEMQQSNNIAKQFMAQYMLEEGPLFEKVSQLRENDHLIARHIFSCAINIKDDVKVSREASNESKETPLSGCG